MMSTNFQLNKNTDKVPSILLCILLVDFLYAHFQFNQKEQIYKEVRERGVRAQPNIRSSRSL